MPIPDNQLIESALSLPQADRADLALQLLRSLTPPSNKITDDEFSGQLHDRIARYRTGEVDSLSLEESRATIGQSLSKKD